MRRGVFHAVIKGAAGVCRVHITEEKEMTQENVYMKIICMDDDTTSSALEEGYCVIALQQK